MRADKKGFADGQIMLIFGILSILVMLVFITIVTVSTTSIEQQTRYTNVDRQGGGQGAVNYESGWLANALANQVITVNEEQTTLAKALTTLPAEEVVDSLDELIDAIDIHIVNPATNQRIKGHYFLFIQDNQLIHSRIIGGVLPQSRIDNFPLPQEYISNNINNPDYGLPQYKQMLKERRHGDRVGELAWTIIPGEKEAVIGVIVW